MERKRGRDKVVVKGCCDGLSTCSARCGWACSKDTSAHASVKADIRCDWPVSAI